MAKWEETVNEEQILIATDKACDVAEKEGICKIGDSCMDCREKEVKEAKKQGYDQGVEDRLGMEDALQQRNDQLRVELKEAEQRGIREERRIIGIFLEESMETFHAIYRDSAGEQTYTIARHAIDKIIKTLKAGQSFNPKEWGVEKK